MSCTKRFMNVDWPRHQWRQRVTSADILTAEEPDMWGRSVFRDYIRCDKQEVCEGCGKVRHQKSCLCEPATAARCEIYLSWRAESSEAAEVK
jgi:threonine dehydratase